MLPDPDIGYGIVNIDRTVVDHLPINKGHFTLDEDLHGDRAALPRHGSLRMT